MIIESKSFHFGNLILQLIQHNDFDDPYYTINIHRDNSHTDYDIFGIFFTYDSAINKFNQIQL